MKKWKCKVCGYTHTGDTAPAICPQCGSPRTDFEQSGTSTRSCSVILVVMLLSAAFITVYACHSTLTVDNTAVRSMDLQRYLGKWYEVARFDHRFERNLQQCTATYTLKENGMLQVTNRGMKDGQWKTSVGKGRVTDVPGVLRVSFFGPFYSDYRVLMLDPEYTYALVGGGSDDYLWILSRTPQLSPLIRDRILREAHRRGYNTSNLIWVNHTSL